MRATKWSVVALAAVAVIAAPVPAFAGPEKEIVINEKPAEGDDLARAQEPLVAAAAAITALDPKRDGLGGIRLQVRKGAVEVYWKGDVPDEVRQEIAVQEANGVTVNLQPADYSGRELDAALLEIVDQRDKYPGLSVLAPRPEGSGLQGYFTDPEAAKEFSFPIPVGVEAAPDGAVPAARQNDTVPFWGGARATINRGPTCTTGFAVVTPGARGVLSAGHCDPAGGGIWTTPPGTLIGVAGPRAFLSDTLFVPSASSGRTYTGNVTSATSKRVIAPTPNFPGQFVCVEGAATGENCLVMNFFVGGAAIVAGALTLGVTLAFHIFGGIAGGLGDSGAPVIVSGNPTVALAAGVFSFLMFPFPCPAGGPPLCSTFVGYVDINWALIRHFPMALAP